MPPLGDEAKEAAQEVGVGVIGTGIGNVTQQDGR